MKNLMILILTGTVRMLSHTNHAWVAAGGGGGSYHAGYSGGSAYHAGYSCGGVTTGTTAAHGYTGYAAGTTVGVATHPVYVAPVYGTAYAVAATPPPPMPPVSGPSVGTIVYGLPPGAQATTINGIRYYVISTTYYQGFFGNNGVYYVVQAGPM